MIQLLQFFHIKFNQSIKALDLFNICNVRMQSTLLRDEFLAVRNVIRSPFCPCFRLWLCLIGLFCSLTQADGAEHLLPEAHLRLPSMPRSQLVPDPLHRDHHCSYCTVRDQVHLPSII